MTKVNVEVPLTDDPFGPQGPHIRALIGAIGGVTERQSYELETARATAERDPKWLEARLAVNRVATERRPGQRDAAWDCFGYAARGVGTPEPWRPTAWEIATRVSAWDAVQALLVRDLIGPGHNQRYYSAVTKEQYDTLTKTWRCVVGAIHPDDQ